MSNQATNQPHPLSIAITVRDHFTDAMIGQYRYERRDKINHKQPSCVRNKSKA
jgi:hypothetical protein